MRENKLLYFEAPSMRELHGMMDVWQKNNSRFLSVGMQKDGNNFCCIALAGKREVVICDPENDLEVRVSGGGNLDVTSYGKSNVVICDPVDDDKARVCGARLQVI